MDRELTDEERKWLIEALTSLKDGNQFMGGTAQGDISVLPKVWRGSMDPKFFLDQIDELRVTGECECHKDKSKTYSIYFQYYKPGCGGLVVMYPIKNGPSVSVFVDDETGKISELEIYK